MGDYIKVYYINKGDIIEVRLYTINEIQLEDLLETNFELVIFQINTSFSTSLRAGWLSARRLHIRVKPEMPWQGPRIWSLEFSAGLWDSLLQPVAHNHITDNQITDLVNLFYVWLESNISFSGKVK